MAKNNTVFGEGPVFTISNYVLNVLFGNTYFTLLNLPILYIVIVILANGVNAAPLGFAVIIFIGCLFIGPAVTALLSVAGKFIREKEINITKDFFKAYKQNFLQATFLGAIVVFTAMILFSIARFLSSQGFPIMVVMFYYWLILFVVNIGLFMFIILSRFKMRSIDIFKLSLYYSVRKIPNTLINIGIIILMVLASIKLLVFILPFTASLIFLILYACNQKMLVEIEEQHTVKEYYEIYN